LLTDYQGVTIVPVLLSETGTIVFQNSQFHNPRQAELRNKELKIKSQEKRPQLQFSHLLLFNS